jgi:hypothetical protein
MSTNDFFNDLFIFCIYPPEYIYNNFAFSDLRHIIAKAALSENFDAVCGNYLKALKNLSSTPCCAWLLESAMHTFSKTSVYLLFNC